MRNDPPRAKPVAVIFGDGGVILKNPSPIAGVWAWCGVSLDGEHVREQSGYVLPVGHPHPGWARVAAPDVTNNMTEFFAILRGIEGMPQRWAGKIATDSEVTLRRFARILEWSGDGIGPIDALPDDWQHRARRALNRVHVDRWVQLAGHPTLAELRDGFKAKDGRKVQVSRHQVWCDEECTRRSREHETALAIPDWAVDRELIAA